MWQEKTTRRSYSARIKQHPFSLAPHVHDFEMIITIDGPAGAGKSTAARGLAKRLGFEFLDTGAMYRAVGWACSQRGIDLQDEARVAAIAAELQLELHDSQILCDGHDISAAIRTAESSQAASVVAANPGVRAAMVDQQRATAAGRNFVTEGRDQGSVVFPNAACKFFLTADARERATRRHVELEQRGFFTPLDRVLAEIHDRDQRDQTREASPLVKPSDAIEIDTSRKTQHEVLDELELTSRQRLGLPLK